MGKQYPCPRIGGCATQRGRRVAALRGIEAMCAVVRHTGEYQRCAVVLQDNVFILEHVHAETPNLLGPCALSGVVLVIAGDKERTVARGQSSQWRGMNR